MVRGDANIFKFKIKDNGTYIEEDTYDEVELQFNAQSLSNSVKKLKTKDEITFNTTDKCFEAPLSQEDTFKLNSGMVEVQVRLFKDDICKGTIVQSINLNKVLSSDIIGG